MLKRITLEPVLLKRVMAIAVLTLVLSGCSTVKG